MLVEQTPNVGDVDDTLVAPQVRQRFVVDRTKAALNGITNAQIAELLGGAVQGAKSASLRLDDQVDPAWITLRLPREQFSRP
jgi:multidrug efflux pump subunit AcrB